MGQEARLSFYAVPNLTPVEYLKKPAVEVRFSERNLALLIRNI